MTTSNSTISKERTGIKLFSNPTFGTVRTAGTPDNPQFCLPDLCRALDLTPSKVSQRLTDDVLSKYPISDDLGREQLTNFVNEDGLYDVILDSRKPEAKAFRKWITSEVLPAIRKTGGYIPSSAEDSPEEIMARAILVANRTMEAQKQRIQMLEGEKQHLEEENKVLAPKAQYTDEVLLSTNKTYTFEEMSKQLNFSSVHKFINQLKEDGVIYRRSDVYMLHAKFSGKGFTVPRTYRFYHRDGSPGTSTLTVFTEKGRAFLFSRYGNRSLSQTS